MPALESMASGHYIGYLSFWMFAVVTLLMEFAWPRMKDLFGRFARSQHSRPNAGATVHHLHAGR